MRWLRWLRSQLRPIDLVVAAVFLALGLVLDVGYDTAVREPQRQAEQVAASQIDSAALTIGSCRAVFAALEPDRLSSLERAERLLGAARDHYRQRRYAVAETTSDEAIAEAKAQGCSELHLEP